MNEMGLLLIGWALIGLALAILIGRAIHLMRHDVDRKQKPPRVPPRAVETEPMMNDEPLKLLRAK